MLKNILIICAIIFIITIFLAFIKKEKTDLKIVRLPKFYTFVFAFCYVLFNVPVFAYEYYNDYSRIDMIILFLITIFISLTSFISTLNWRITYDETGFYYRTSFNHTLCYTYSDIEKVKRTKIGTILIKSKNRWLFIDPYAIGLDDFMKQF